jgi:hypothetical protein
MNGTAEFRVSTAHGGEVVEASLPPRVIRPDAGRHVIRFSIDEFREYELAGDESAQLPSHFRFCLGAIDPWGNVSRPSCARFEFR